LDLGCLLANEGSVYLQMKGLFTCIGPRLFTCK
jgi:hypothetical protein